MLFDSTLRRELARNFGGTLVVLMTIVLVVLVAGAHRLSTRIGVRAA